MSLEATIPIMQRIAAYLPKDSKQHWGAGCDKCNYGIVAAPELTGAVELYLERIVQALNGDITFCECQAGTRYRVSLLNRRQKLIEDARKGKLMAAYAQRQSHPDLELAQKLVLQSYEAHVPTIHLAEEPTP